MKKQKVTLADIANALGTSTVSISRALTGQPGISEELRNKVVAKAKELGYEKTYAKSNSLKILVLHQTPFVHDNSNFSDMIQGIEKALQEAGADYDLEYVDKETQKRLQPTYKMSKEANFDGVILIGRFDIPYADFIHSKIRNLIFFTGYSPSYDYDSVWFSFLHAGYKQCEYLIQNGHQSVGFIGNKTYYRNKEKLLGISLALEENGLPVREELFLHIEDDFRGKLLEMIDAQTLPTAFICDHDFSALETIKFFHENNIKVPKDVSVMGSGNTESSRLSIPSLTTMELQIEYACEAVVATLLKRIYKPDKPGENVAVLSRLLERDSVSRRQP